MSSKKKHACPKCSRTYSTRQGMNNHMKKCTEGDDIVVETAVAVVRKNICMFCYRDDFDTQTNLLNHITTCRKVAEIVIENKQLKQKIAVMEADHEEQLDYYRQRNDELKQELIEDKNRFAELAMSSAEISNKSITAIIAHMKNHPNFKSIEDFTFEE